MVLPLPEPAAISIHAPRVGSDPYAAGRCTRPRISIHAPRVGSDHMGYAGHSPAGDFNPRSPCGERRWVDPGVDILGTDFNPRSPCGERRPEDKMEHLIRAFQSTLPVWGATPAEFYVAKHNYISIHAPRVGSDVFTPCTVASSTDFNPRSPCGERRWPGLWGPIRRYFNPRSPCGERRSAGPAQPSPW